MLTGDLWFVQVEGQMYGPYTTLQMKGYIDEGRVLPGSLVTSNQSQPVRPVREFTAFSDHLMTRQDLSQPFPAPTHTTPNAYAAPQPYTDLSSHTAPIYTDNALELTTTMDSHPNQAGIAFIMAEFQNGKSLMFIQALQSLGTTERIGENVWLLKTVYSAQSLKRALCEALNREDRLFIVNSFTQETAWHNMGLDMEKRIQTLWASVTP